jgi:hypothetical protein
MKSETFLIRLGWSRFCRGIFSGLIAGSLLMSGVVVAAPPEPLDYFVIRVVDEQTGRGVPLVELRTTSESLYYTDSNGLVAFYEPGLMGQEVFFYVKSHGYEFPVDGFGYRGVALKVVSGGKATLKLKRINIAERLYRLTGEGIYRDTVLFGRVTGQDSVVAVPYRGQLYWFWGDTMKPGYPLGHFGTAGATSALPGQGGLDPSVGVDLTYFTGGEGFSRPMCDWDAPGMKWIDGATVTRDSAGRERLVAQYSSHKSLDEIHERGLIVFNDDRHAFDRLHVVPLDTPLLPNGQPVRVRSGGGDYFYFDIPYPTPSYRARATWDSVTNPAGYEGFTCLSEGSRYAKAETRLDRTADGGLRYGWKRGTAPLSPRQEEDLVRRGEMKPEERFFQQIDVETGHRINAQGSVAWNAFRHRWILVGWANLSDVYYAEADTPLGPWVYARRVVTHTDYSFYNPRQHPFFDQEGGRRIYFEGTYSDTFSAPPVKTPRYNYNQIMYRLDLADERLELPAPVYRVRAAEGRVRYAMRDAVEAGKDRGRVESAPFFAFEPSRHPKGTVPMFGVIRDGRMALRHAAAVEDGEKARPVFYALPVTANTDEKGSARGAFALSAVVPLYEYQSRKKHLRIYSTNPALPAEEWTRSDAALCRVWKNPRSFLAIEPEANHD